MLLAALFLLAACTGDPEPSPSASDEAADSGPGAPEVPIATEPAPQGLPTPANPDPVDMLDEMEPPAPGNTVLVHLEGPLGNREATDVVVRTEEGEEVDRFRLPGAVGMWAAPGASEALIRTLPDGFARYDAVSGQLALVSFGMDDPPSPSVVPGDGIHGPTVLWEPDDLTTMLRLDSGTVTPMEDLVAPGSSVVASSRSGSVVLLDLPNGFAVLQTRTAEVRPLDAVAVALSESGLTVASVGPPPDRQVVVEAVDGSTRRVVGTVEQPAVPHPLEDGRVLLLGQAPGIMGVDGTITPLEPSAPLMTPIRVSADGTTALAVSGDGLAIVDLTTGTATPVPDSTGYEPMRLGPGSVLWATGTDGTVPGGLVVDPATRNITRFLADLPVRSVDSLSADGRTITVTVATDIGASSMLVRADGSSMPLLDGADRSTGSVHPGGEEIAVAVLTGDDRRLVVGLVADGVMSPIAEVPTGRDPVWLSTVGPDPVAVRQ